MYNQKGEKWALIAESKNNVSVQKAGIVCSGNEWPRSWGIVRKWGFRLFFSFFFLFFFKSGKDVFKSLLGFTNWCGVKKMSCPSADSLSLKIQGYVVLCPSWASNTDSEKKFEKKKKHASTTLRTLLGHSLFQPSAYMIY